jgi:thiamine kinase-like enzyme
LREASGPRGITSLAPVSGGTSGALTYRAQAGRHAFLLRIETRLHAAIRNPVQYDCLRIAAAEGIAPPVRYVDAGAGVVIMDFLEQRPLSEYPGGAMALVGAAGELVRRLQATPAFPELRPFTDVVARLLGFLRTSGLFAEGLLDAHAEGFERIRAAYTWLPSALVSSHNDPNMHNVLFDGARIWLVDWEAACRNDRLVDVAILLENLAPTPELEETLVRAWLGGGAPDALVRARLRLMRLLTRLYYAGLLGAIAGERSQRALESDLAAPTPAEFGAAVARGELTPASDETLWLLTKMCLASFLEGLEAPGFEDALILAAAQP